MIIDAHTHLGECKVFGDKVSEKELIDTMDKNEVKTSIVQPFPGDPDPVSTHNRIASLSKKYPGRIFGMVSLNPHMDKDEYFKEVERCIKELGFVGIKLHPTGHAVSPFSEDAKMVFKIADELKIPVMVHTGPGLPFALPALYIPVAHQFPGLSIILAHAGFAIFTSEAYVAAKECKNIFLETSWCIVNDIKWLINSIGSERLMFGSDLPRNVPVEIIKYKVLGLSKRQIDDCLWQTAKRIFKLKIS